MWRRAGWSINSFKIKVLCQKMCVTQKTTSLPLYDAKKLSLRSESELEQSMQAFDKLRVRERESQGIPSTVREVS